MAGDEIPILFSTNAGPIGKEVDNLTRSVTAETAANTKANAVTQESIILAKSRINSLRQAAAAAKINGDENAAGAQIALKKAQQELFVMQQSTALAKIKAAENKKMYGESRASLGKGAAFLGVGRAFGGAAAVLGGSAGIGSMVAMTAAMAGVGLAIGAIVTGVGMAIDKFTELPRALEASKKAMEDLAAATGQRATALLGAVGSGARNLIGQGGNGMDLAKQFAGPAGGLDESIKATALAKQLFKGNAALALENAKAGTQVSGGSFSDNLKSMEGSSLASLQSGAAGRGIVARARGGPVSIEEMALSRDRLAADPTMQVQTRLQTAEGNLQVSDFGKQAEIMTELFKKINEQLGITVKANDAQLKQDQADADARREIMQRSAIDNPIAF